MKYQRCVQPRSPKVSGFQLLLFTSLMIGTSAVSHPESDCNNNNRDQLISNRANKQPSTLTETRQTGPSCYSFKGFDKDRIRVRRDGETTYFYRVKASIETPMTLVLVNPRGELVEVKEYVDSKPADRDFR